MTRCSAAVPLLLAVTLFLTSCKNNQEETADEKPVPLAVSQLSGPFTESFSKILNSYFELKDALVSEDTVKANASAATLWLNAEDLNVSEIAGDTTNMIAETARLFAMNIGGSARSLAEKNNIDQKRREFYNISDALWSLTRTVRYDGGKIYYQFCPMAFDNAGAYWLSRTREIRNPYFGDKMLKCGEVTDSLEYSKR